MLRVAVVPVAPAELVAVLSVVLEQAADQLTVSQEQ
jgi:hypothetical protein